MSFLEVSFFLASLATLAFSESATCVFWIVSFAFVVFFAFFFLDLVAIIFYTNLIWFLYAVYVFYRICSIFFLPNDPGCSFCFSSYRNYAACILYKPMLLLLSTTAPPTSIIYTNNIIFRHMFSKLLLCPLKKNTIKRHTLSMTQ